MEFDRITYTKCFKRKHGVYGVGTFFHNVWRHSLETALHEDVQMTIARFRPPVEPIIENVVYFPRRSA